MYTAQAPELRAEDMPNFGSAAELADEGNPFISQWRARSIGDALQPRPAPVYFVDRILRAGSLTMVYGAPGSLKSMLLMDMMACIAAGVPWLRTLPGKPAEQTAFPTSRIPCLWLDYDNGEDLTDERFEAFARTYNLPADAPITYYSLPIPWLDLSRRSDALNFMGLIQRSGARVVVIDNLSLIKGSASENSDEMRPVMSHLREIVNATRCAVVLVHHQRKMGTNTLEAGAPRKGDTVRGWSGIEGAFDLILHVDRPPRQDYVLVSPAKVRRSKPFESIGALFSYESSEDDVLKGASFWAWPTDDAKTALAKQIKATILDMVGAHPGCNQAKIVEHTADWFAAAGQKKPGRDTIRGLLKQMVEDGDVTERPGAKASNQREMSYFKP